MRTNWKACLILLALIVVICVQLERKKSGEEAFASVWAKWASTVEAHFAQWDRNHDGQLSAEEMENLVRDPEVTGDQAAAVAAIHWYQRRCRPKIFTRPRDVPVGNAEPIALTRAMLLVPTSEVQKQGRFANNFWGFRAHIDSVPRAVFAAPDAPCLAGFHQGNLGDCYLLASAAAALHANPSAFKGVFQPYPDASCDVSFPSGHRVRVSKLTDAEIALSSNAGKQGLWLNVLEMAFGQLKIDRERWEGKAPADPVDLDVIGGGGDTVKAIEVLSGKQAKFLSIRHARRGETAGLTTQLHYLLSTGLPRRFLFCCSVEHPQLPPGIVNNHAYAILGYDAPKQIVTVMNPWGNRFQPSGPPGLANGYATESGKFDVPLDEFIAVFDCFYYQTEVSRLLVPKIINQCR